MENVFYAKTSKGKIDLVNNQYHPKNGVTVIGAKAPKGKRYISKSIEAFAKNPAINFTCKPLDWMG